MCVPQEGILRLLSFPYLKVENKTILNITWLVLLVNQAEDQGTLVSVQMPLEISANHKSGEDKKLEAILQGCQS